MATNNGDVLMLEAAPEATKPWASAANAEALGYEALGKRFITKPRRLSKDNKEEYLEKAGTDLEAVREQHFARLMKELQGTDFWKLRRAYSPGSVQEYVEAATFYKFCVLLPVNLKDDFFAVHSDITTWLHHSLVSLSTKETTL
ncbi:hypothetical protein Bca101_036407 [Brassica carinata]